ncbi:hypothetical protein EW146_g7008 [Bondarzewia mesenterica]|uniref:Acyl-coenzyme A oxidase n=1 Tax=Bondarzewia mesenterica TaxID=1095465 RepID=A0A4S4LMQ1_9AGAM|nr:hypothetical protein EW146_g7008 [Bondarzewia mesenterica]
MSSSKVAASEQTTLDLEHARRTASVDVVEVRKYLYDGQKQWEQHEAIVRVLSADPVFDKSRRYNVQLAQDVFMTRSERFNRALALMERVFDLEERLGWSPTETADAWNLIDDGVPINLHNIAFEPVFMSQGSESLQERYGALVKHRGIIGCYMQTELGHGSNVSALETTATFVPDTQEFEINSPTLTSSKWWIGGLGKTATHGIVQAKLILPDGNDVGPHLFFVQLRSLVDHTVLPGIRIGDIGPKAMGGWANMDHGFAHFDHIRIPRGNMLSQFAEVTKEGKYVRPPHAKMSYGGMLYIRSGMVTSAGWVIAKAATISLRYATVRRQGNKDADGPEQQVILYPSTYYRLLPILARAYVFIQLGRQLTSTFESTSARLAQGDTSTLAEMHATTSGLKVLVTTAATRDIETARRSMGGHGFSAFAGLGRIYAEYLPAATYEGDNFVLDHQVVRAALKAYHALKASSGLSADQLSPSSRYLRLLIAPQPAPPSLSSPSAWRDPDTLVLALEWRAAFVVQAHAQSTGSQDANAAQRVSNAVTEAFVATQVGEMIKNLSGSSLAEQDAQVVRQLYTLYLLVTVETGLVDLLSFGLLPTRSYEGTDNLKDPAHDLRAAIAGVCSQLLLEAIALSDAFGYTDWELDSALGVYDGRVYQTLWERIQSEPLNEQEVTPGYKARRLFVYDIFLFSEFFCEQKYIKPILERGRRLAKKNGVKL